MNEQAEAMVRELRIRERSIRDDIATLEARLDDTLDALAVVRAEPSETNVTRPRGEPSA